MSRALLVGAGAMGSRHLQGLAKAPDLDEVLVIEPQAEAISRAEALWHEVPEARGKKLRFLDWPSLDRITPPAFALIATSAPGRLPILEHLLQFGMRRLLIEKIPFQSVAQYRRAVELTAAAQADVRVNLPLRMVPLFQILRQRLAGQSFTFDVACGDLGLGCNGLHYFDLFCFLADTLSADLALTIDKPARPSARGADLIDFSGRAGLRSQTGADGAVTFVAGSKASVVLTVSAGDFRLVADFSSGKVETAEPELAAAPCFSPMASQLAHRQMAEILAGTSVLPGLAEGFELNRQMLNGYNSALAGRADDAMICPIT